jgi:hypothetical protein
MFTSKFPIAARPCYGSQRRFSNCKCPSSLA